MRDGIVKSPSLGALMTFCWEACFIAVNLFHLRFVHHGVTPVFARSYAQARRAQRILVFCPSGDGDGQKEYASLKRDVAPARGRGDHFCLPVSRGKQKRKYLSALRDSVVKDPF
jgi:hypothetical protein